MAERTPEQTVQLGCGTFIVIGLIVLIFTRSSTDDIVRDLGDVRSEITELRKLVEAQSAQLEEIHNRLPEPTAGLAPEAAATEDAPAP